MLLGYGIYNSHRRLCQYTDAWRHNLIIIRILLYGQICLILPGDQHISLSFFYKCRSSSSGSRIKHQYILIEFFHKLFGLFFVIAVLLLLVSPCCEEIPACTSGGFRIRCNDIHALFDQIIPIMNPLFIPFSNQKYDG